MNFIDINERLEARRPTFVDLRLDRVITASKLLGNPEREFKSAHIAGTNGKGSTAAFLTNALVSSGHRVGLLTSPHLVTVRERIKIDGNDIPEEEFSRYYDLIEDVEKRGKVGTLTYYEIITLMAFKYFADKKIDYAVIETGLGGKFDATNIVRPCVSILTRISMDHQKWLGDTIEEIARAKCGIIKEGVPVVTIQQDEQVMTEILRAVLKLKSRLVIARGLDETITLGLNGFHQRENASLALEALKIALGDNFDNASIPLNIKGALERTRWPGRLDVVSENPLIILDGAHNPGGMKILVEYLRENYAEKRKTFVVSMMSDKDMGVMLKILSDIADEWAFVPLGMERASRPEALVDVVHAVSARSRPVRVYSSLKEAIGNLTKKSSENDLICVTGSLYLVGEYLSYIPLLCKEG